MKTMLRIFFVLLFCVVVFFCIVPAASADTVASGECGAQGDNLTWTLDEKGKLIISGTGAMANYNQGTAPWYSNRLAISTVTIENGVTSIGWYAFYYCSKLTDISIPWGVTTIGLYAFNGCSQLSDVTVPGSVTDINLAAFYECTGLTAATVENGVKSIESYAFYGCTSLISVTIPNSVTKVGSFAFSGCSKLKSIIIPSNMTNIETASFENCRNLTNVTISEGVVSIGVNAFSGCTSLTSVTIPTSVANIGAYAFHECSNLANVSIPVGVVSIGEGAFYGCSSLKSVRIPSSVTNIGESSFSNCRKLTDIFVDSGNDMFCDLEGVLYNKSMTKLCAFPDNRGGDYYNIPPGVENIGDWSFSACRNLKSVTIPSSVTYIGEHAFSNCFGLNDVYYNGIQEQWHEISVGNGNFSLTGAMIHYITPDFILPVSLTAIGDEAFTGGAFTYVKLSENTISIGQCAFADCPNLAYIYIPEATTEIDVHAFGNMQGLMIIGKTGSAAETYAEDHGYTFVVAG